MGCAGDMVAVSGQLIPKLLRMQLLNVICLCCGDHRRQHCCVAICYVAVRCAAVRCVAVAGRWLRSLQAARDLATGRPTTLL
jgi:hypothetical protein